MPGLIGFSHPQRSDSQGISSLNDMADLLYHQPFYERDKVFARDGIFGSRIHNASIGNHPQPVYNQGVFVWLDGECYDTERFEENEEGACDASLLCSLYLQDKDLGFLENLNGVFSAVMYDQQQQKIHFLTDRFGLRLLYYVQQGDKLAWGSEPKAMFGLDWFEPQINEEAVHDFFTQSHMSGQKSWFNNLELFPAASIVTWDLNAGKFTGNREYWDMNQIKTLPPQTEEAEIVKELGSRFRKAVQRQAQPLDRVGITLSGGLDSRAIFAAIPESEDPIHASTFGKAGSHDIKIAGEVCKLKGATHHVTYLTSENWLKERIEGVWWTDGHFNLKHMHSLVQFPQLRDWFTINLGGFLAGTVIGGDYLFQKGKTLKQIIYNSGRRYTNEGSRLFGINGIRNRRPFFDYDLMDFIVAIPADLKNNSLIYNKMLLNEFPEYFRSIPWQRTGFSISSSHTGNVFKRKVSSLKARGLRLYKKMGGNVGNRKKNLHNYSEWLRMSSSFVNEVLNNPEAIYPEFISGDQVLNTWTSHMNGLDKPNKICAYLTFELYLQQVYENRYRPEV